MRKLVLSVVLSSALLVGGAGCSATVQKLSNEAWQELKRVARVEGEEAAVERIEKAKQELAAKGIDPEQIDSMMKLMLEYWEKRDKEKGGLDLELMMNLLIAYLGGSYIKRKLPGMAPPAGPAPVA